METFFQLNDTARHITPLVDICELSELHIPDAIGWKRRAQQEARSNFSLLYHSLN